MAQKPYTLSINGAAAVSAEAAGVRLRTRVRQNQAPDSVVMEVPRRVGGPFLLQPGDRVRIYLDEAPFFSGRVPVTGALQSAADGRQSLTVQGPWHEMGRWTVLAQETDASDPVLDDDVSDSGDWTSRIFLYNNGAGGVVTSGTDLMSRMRQYEWLKRADPDWVMGTVPSGVAPPRWEVATGLRLNQLVQRALQWQPGTLAWFDYSVFPPVLNVTKMISTGSVPLITYNRATSPYTLAYASGTGAEVPEDLTLGAPPVRGWTLSRRADMVPSCVHVRTEDSSTYTEIAQQRDPPAQTPNAEDALWVLREDVAAAGGTASFLLDMLGVLQVDGSLTLQGTGGPYELARPGRVWALAGDDELTDGTLCVTQSVQDNLQTHETLCRVGLPRQLGIEDLMTLARYARVLTGLTKPTPLP